MNLLLTAEYMVFSLLLFIVKIKLSHFLAVSWMVQRNAGLAGSRQS
jgi:hypothetical protein